MNTYISELTDDKTGQIIARIIIDNNSYLINVNNTWINISSSYSLLKDLKLKYIKDDDIFIFLTQNHCDIISTIIDLCHLSRKLDEKDKEIEIEEEKEFKLKKYKNKNTQTYFSSFFEGIIDI